MPNRQPGWDSTRQRPELGAVSVLKSSANRMGTLQRPPVQEQRQDQQRQDKTVRQAQHHQDAGNAGFALVCWQPIAAGSTPVSFDVRLLDPPCRIIEYKKALLAVY